MAWAESYSRSYAEKHEAQTEQDEPDIGSDAPYEEAVWAHDPHADMAALLADSAPASPTAAPTAAAMGSLMGLQRGAASASVHQAKRHKADPRAAAAAVGAAANDGAVFAFYKKSYICAHVRHSMSRFSNPHSNPPLCPATPAQKSRNIRSWLLQGLGVMISTPTFLP